jgi:plastocyanin
MMGELTRVIWGFAPLGALAFVVTACGGGSSSTAATSPSPTPPPAGGGTSTPTITIANNTVTPKNITATRGSRVTFVNNDNQPHDMESDPHPVHTDCPEINQVGLLSPGQSRQTGALNTARTCGYHDHNRDMVASLQGTITIQ